MRKLFLVLLISLMTDVALAEESYLDEGETTAEEEAAVLPWGKKKTGLKKEEVKKEEKKPSKKSKDQDKKATHQSSNESKDQSGDPSGDIPLKPHRKPSSLSGMKDDGYRMTLDECPIFESDDEGSAKVSETAKGRKIWTEPAGEGWVKVHTKKSTGFIQKACLD